MAKKIKKNDKIKIIAGDHKGKSCFVSRFDGKKIVLGGIGLDAASYSKVKRIKIDPSNVALLNDDGSVLKSSFKVNHDSESRLKKESELKRLSKSINKTKKLRFQND